MFDPLKSAYLLAKVGYLFFEVIFKSFLISFDYLTLFLVSLVAGYFVTNRAHFFMDKSEHRLIPIAWAFTFYFAFLTSLPYILVQKGFALGLNQDRQNFLMIGPMSVSLMLMMYSYLPNANWRQLTFTLIFSFFLTTTISRQLDYQLRAIKDKAVEQALLLAVKKHDPDVIFVSDRIKLNSKFEDINWYIDHYLAGILAKQDGQFKRVGILADQKPSVKISLSNVAFFLQKFKLENYYQDIRVDSQIYVQFEQKRSFAQKFSLVSEYYAIMLFNDNAKAYQFYRSLISTEVHVLD